tara:strand:- start:5460 stop:5663 length:204 start_codon:yes stop_codon:yes gene_type:complete
MSTFAEDMGLVCPNCGRRDRLNVAFTGTALITEDGTEDVGDHEWTSESAMRCGNCGHSATVADFTEE